MLTYLRSTNASASLRQLKTLRAGTWIRCERPSDDEKAQLLALGIDADILTDALDPHEIPRIEVEGAWAYFITRVPDIGDNFNDFTTPIMFALSRDYTVTISRDTLGRLWQPFIDTKTADTTDQPTFFMLMVQAIVSSYQNRVAYINRQMRAATSDLRSLHSADIATLTEYERKLNDYLDALLPTNTAIEKLLSGRMLRLQTDDLELVEDVSIDLEQLIARCKSLLRTITNVRDSYRAVMDTKLNETIRLLTVITLALTIPTMLAGLFGMNVDLPTAAHSPITFWAIVVVSVAFAVSFSLYFLRKR